MRLSATIAFVIIAAGWSVCPTVAADDCPPFRIAGRTSRAIQKYTGLTFLCEKSIEVASGVTARVLLGGRPRLDLELYSATDAFSGKFKSVKVKFDNCSYHKIPLPDLIAQSNGPLQVRLFRKPGVVSPVMLSVAGTTSEAEVAKALKSRAVASSLRFLKLSLPGLGQQQLQVLNPEVDFRAGRILIDCDLITAGGKPGTGIALKIDSRPVLESERFIVLQDSKIDSPDIIEPEKFAVFAEDLLNPLVDFGRMDRHTHAFRLKSFSVDDSTVRFAGNLLLAPKPVSSDKSQLASGGKANK